MDLFNILQKLQAIGQISEAEEKCNECGEIHEGSCSKSKMKEEQVEEAKKPDADGDGVPDWADDDNEKVEEGVGDLVKKGVDVAKKVGQKALDTLGHGSDEEMRKDLQRKMGMEPTGKKPGEEVKESELDLLRKLAGLQECGDMDQMAQMSPISDVSDVATPVQVIQALGADQGAEEQPGQEVQQQMAQEPEQEAARYTLTITNGDSNLSMTTDVPDEIIHIMKLAGVNKGAEVSKAPVQDGGEEQGEKEVEEAWGNTPAATKEKEPRGYGDIRDWGMKGTGGGKASSAANKPFGSGDNPLSEDAILSDYQLFKSSK